MLLRPESIVDGLCNNKVQLDRVINYSWWGIIVLKMWLREHWCKRFRNKKKIRRPIWKKSNKIEKIISNLTQWKIVWMVLKRQSQCSLANWNPLIDGTKWKTQVLRWHCSYFFLTFHRKKVEWQQMKSLLVEPI